MSEQVAIMVNGKINRIMDAGLLAADRDLQQALLGVGRHAHDETPVDEDALADQSDAERSAPKGPLKVYVSNPKPPTRWSQPVPVRVIESEARTQTTVAPAASATIEPLRLAHRSAADPVFIAGTLDTKGAELRFVRDLLEAQGVRVRMVDLSTSGKPSEPRCRPMWWRDFIRVVPPVSSQATAAGASPA